jgi:type I restriction enzyme S subunit
MKIIKIGNIAKVFNGYAFKSSEYSDEGFQVIRITNVQSGYIVNNNPKFIKLTNEQQKKFILAEGDILISLTGNVGRVGRIGKENLPAVLNQRVGKLIIHSKEVFPDYLFHILNSNLVEAKLIENAKGIAQKNIGSSDIEKIEIPLPPFEDQKRIVKILDEADALRQKRKQAITLLDDYLKSVFLDMFGDPIKNPKGWKSKEISELCRVKIGPFGSLLHKSDYIPDGIPLVNPKHMINGKIIVDPENCISKEKHNQLKDYHLKTGDLIMARRGEIGRCAVVTPQEDKFLCGTGSIFLRPEGEVNNVFLHYLFTTESMVRVFENGANGVTMQNLNANTVKKTNIIYPPINIQNKFSDIFTKTSELKKVMITQSAELEIGFQALMQKAFKGEL